MVKNIRLSVISPTVNNIGSVYLVICDNEFYYYLQVVGITKLGIAKYRIQQTDGGYTDVDLAINIEINKNFPEELKHKEHKDKDINLTVTGIFSYDEMQESYFGFCKLKPE